MQEGKGEGHFTITTIVYPQSSYGTHVRLSDLAYSNKIVLSLHNSKSLQAILEALNLVNDVL